jgi:hypothetical protein
MQDRAHEFAFHAPYRPELKDQGLLVVFGRIGVDASGKIVDFLLDGAFLCVIDAVKLTSQFFFLGLFSAFSLTALIPAAERFRIRTEFPIDSIAAAWRLQGSGILPSVIMASGMRAGTAAAHGPWPGRHGTRRTSTRSERSARPGGTAFLRPGFINRQWTTFKVLVVVESNRFLRLCIIAVFNKRETALPARLAIEGHKYIQDTPRTAEMRADLILGGLVGKVPNKKTNRHLYLVKTLIWIR